MNVEFKVGDKLYARKSGGNHTEGCTYEVIEIEHDNFVYIHITGDRENACIREEIMPRFFGRVSEVPQVTKVKLTQEQARALENAMKDSDIEYVITAHATAGEWVPDEKRALNELSVADLARALLIGYDVEQTAEEKVLEAWVKRDPNDETIDEYEMMRHAGFRKGMKFTLDAYGIKVKGINDND